MFMRPAFQAGKALAIKVVTNGQEYGIQGQLPAITMISAT